MPDDIEQSNIVDELDEWITPTPLSDPVLTAIFQNAEVSGFVMRSLLNATLEDSGDKPISKVVTVTPQSVHSDTSSRGFRIDVKTWTEDGEIALFEVQLKPFSAMVERALLYAEQALASDAKRGQELEEVASAMPKVIVVNMLEKAIRKTGGFHQVVELLYKEPPYERATDKLSIHNLELDKFRKMEKLEEEKAGTPLRCWLSAICRSQDTKKPMTEVVKMDPELQAYYDIDPGFAQFVERHGVVAAMPDIRNAYRRWEYDQILDRLDEERRVAEHKAEVAEGELRGEATATKIMKLFIQKKQPEEISTELSIPIKKVTSILKESGLID